MTRRVFLDVGAHTGESLVAALDPAFRFDHIHCFEPASACWPRLEDMADKRTSIERYGLWNRTCEYPLFDAGSKGASMWRKDKPGQTKRIDLWVPCRFRRASEWFAENLTRDDTVWLKLNVEGAECDILDDLLDSGEFDKVTYCMIDFDVRKIAGQKHREGELRARLEPYQFPRWATTKEVMVGSTHAERIKHWLKVAA